MSAPKNRTCSIADCGRVVEARGWCETHYHRWRRRGDPLAVNTELPEECVVEDCTEKRRTRGWCNSHYKRWRRWGDPLFERTKTEAPGAIGAPESISARGLTGCVIDDCGQPIAGRGRCRKHYGQWWRATQGSDRDPAFKVRVFSVEDRFRSKFDQLGPNDCWTWKPKTVKGGYGRFYVSPSRGGVPAHVYAVELATGETCPPGKEGCHRCDNPPCVNPAHIYYGTRQQNVDDMVNRGRAVRGTRHPLAKLTEAAVLLIRTRHANGATKRDLANEFRVSPAVITAAVRGVTWKHVGGPIAPTGAPECRNIRGEAA